MPIWWGRDLKRVLLTGKQYIMVQENYSFPFNHREQLYMKVLHSPPPNPMRIHVLRLMAFLKKSGFLPHNTMKMHVFLLKHILAFVSLCEKSPLLSLSYLSNIGNAPALLLICLAWCTHGICFISCVELASLKSLQVSNSSAFDRCTVCTVRF